MTEARREQYRASHRRWRARPANLARRRAYMRAWRAAHRVHIRELHRKWSAANLAHKSAYLRAWRARRKQAQVTDATWKRVAKLANKTKTRQTQTKKPKEATKTR